MHQIKQYLARPLVLSQPRIGEPLYIYLVIFDIAVNFALVRVDNVGIQQLVYFVSNTMLSTKTRYSKLERVALALQVSTKKLRPYFQAHQIGVLTDQPI